MARKLYDVLVMLVVRLGVDAISVPPGLVYIFIPVGLWVPSVLAHQSHDVRSSDCVKANESL